MLLNSTNLNSLFLGYSAAFQQGLSGVTPTYSRVAMTVPSTTRTQEYGWLGQMPRIREWIGDRAIQNITTYGYAIRNRPFELTVGVDRDDIQDDNLGMYAPLFSEMGRASASFPDELVWPMLAGGFSTPCYDGQYFFDTDHPVLDATGTTVSVSNSGGGIGAPWFLMDVTRGYKPVIYQERQAANFIRMDGPTDEVVFDRKLYRYGIDMRCNAGYGFWQLAYGSRQPLDFNSYGAARTGMMGMKGDYGRPLGLMPRLLVVPPSLEFAGLQLLNAERNAAGATNVYAGTAELLVVPWLS